MWLFVRGVQRFVAVSDETRRELRAVGVPAERITYIRYGVDIARFRPPTEGFRHDLRQRLGMEGRKVVLVSARLVPEKGFLTLLAAWPAVKAAAPSATLVFVGDGCQRSELEEQAAGLEDVRFVGEQRDPLPFLQAADCFTLPSFTEGQPLSLLEAMATGLPCVASDIGGIAEALGDEGFGILVPPGDAQRLAVALVQMLELDDASRTSHAELAHRYVVEHHSLAANATALRRLYDELTAR
jgi:glycosyltransferase involved in cell wall biosynthesis